MIFGEMAEWLKAAVLKTVVGASLPGVRIPLSPPYKKPHLFFVYEVFFLKKKEFQTKINNR